MAVLFAATAAVGYLAGKSTLGRAAICVSLIAAGGFRTELQTSEFPSNHIFHFTTINEQMTIVGEVVSEPDIRPNKTFIAVAVDSLSYQGRQIRSIGKIRLKIREATNRFNYRDRIRFTGFLNRPLAGRNPGAFNYRRFLEIREIYGLVTLPSAERIELVQSGAMEPFIRNLVAPIREYISYVYEAFLPRKAAALMKGFLIGDVRFIPRSVYQKFKDTGTLHVLAVSGANVGYVVGALMLFLRLFRVPRNYKYVKAIIAIVLFSFLAYNQPSVVRASVMAITVLVGLILHRDITPLNIVGFSALLILAFRPLYLFDVGFQLSYAAAFGLIVVMPSIQKLMPVKKKPRNWLARQFLTIFGCTVAAQLAVTPILLYHFHTVPLVSFLSNLVIVPLVAVATMLGIGLVFVSAIPGLSTLTAWLLGLTLKYIMASIDFFHTFPIPQVRMAALSMSAMFLYYSCFLAVVAFIARWRSLVTFITLAALTLNVFIWGNVFVKKQPELKLTFLDTYTENCTVIVEQSGKTTLINGGGKWEHFNRGQSIVLPFLISEGISKIDRVAAAHHSPDNYESIIAVLSGLENLSSVDTIAVRKEQEYRECIELIDPIICLSTDEVQIVILSEFIPAVEICDLPDQIDLLACGWQYLQSGELLSIVQRFQVESIIITNYPNRYQFLETVKRFQQNNPELKIHTVVESGGIVVEIEDRRLKIHAEVNI